MRREDVLWAFSILALLLCVMLLWKREVNAVMRPDLEVTQTDHLVLGFGPSLNGNTNPKFASVGYEKAWENLSFLVECRGIFSDPINGACSVVASARVETVTGLFMRVGAGPAYVFRTDDRVSSLFNFNLQGAVGLTNKGFDIGLCYGHYSNAGIAGANLGRDFIGPVVEINL